MKNIFDENKKLGLLFSVENGVKFAAAADIILYVSKELFAQPVSILEYSIVCDGCTASFNCKTACEPLYLGRYFWVAAEKTYSQMCVVYSMSFS